MDLTAPIADVIPGHRAAVLATLLRLREPVTGRELVAQAAVPVATTARIIEDLADAGLVDQRPAGRAIGVVLNRQHLAVPALELLVGIRLRLIELLRSTIDGWDAPAAAGWIFGSAARGSGDRRSDIDLIVVARREPTTAWERQIASLGDLASASTGNNVQLLDYTRRRFRELVVSGNPLIRSLRTEGIELVDGSATLLKSAMTSRRHTCTKADARARYVSAVAFIDAATLDEVTDADVIVTNAVHAGIAASDSLCCLRLGERSADQDHSSAAKMLSRVDKSLANELGRLLSLKTTAAYESRRVSRADAKKAVRRAQHLVTAAGEALTAS